MLRIQNSLRMQPKARWVYWGSCRDTTHGNSLLPTRPSLGFSRILTPWMPHSADEGLGGSLPGSRLQHPLSCWLPIPSGPPSQLPLNFPYPCEFLPQKSCLMACLWCSSWVVQEPLGDMVSLGMPAGALQPSPFSIVKSVSTRRPCVTFHSEVWAGLGGAVGLSRWSDSLMLTVHKKLQTDPLVFYFL